MINIYTFVQKKQTYFIPLVALLLTNTISCKKTDTYLPAHQQQPIVAQGKETEKTIIKEKEKAQVKEEKTITEDEPKIEIKEEEKPITKKEEPSIEDGKKVDTKEEVHVKTQPEQKKHVVREDGQKRNNSKQTSKSTLPTAKKKRLSIKKKTSEAAKDTEASVQVNEAELLIKKRLFKFIQHEPWKSQIFFKTLTHPIFFGTYNKLLGDLTGSLKHNPSLLNETSIRDINLFTGSLTSPRYHLSNKLSEMINLKLLPAKLGLNLHFTALNNDRKRIKQYRKYIAGWKNHPKEAFEMKRIYEEASSVSNDVIMFLARDHIPFPITQAVAGLVKFDRDPLMGWLVQLGMIKAETLEQMEVGVGAHKFIKVNIGLLETFSEAEKHLGSITRIFNTFQWLVNKLTGGWLMDPVDRDNTLFSPGPPSKRLPYTFLNVFWKRGKALWRYLTGRGGSFSHFFTGGTDQRNNLWHDTIDSDDYNWSSLSCWFTLFMSPFSWAYHCIIDVSRSIMRLIMLYTEMMNILTHWQRVTIALQNFLKNMVKHYELIVKAVNIIQSNPALEKALTGPILDKMKAFVNHQKTASIIKPLKNISDKKPTLWDMFWPWNKLAITLYTSYKQLAGMPAEDQKLFLETTIGFSLFNIYQALGTHVYMSEKNLVKDKICLLDIKEQKSPALSLHGLYTPLTRGDKVLNDFSIGTFETDKKQGSTTFIDGQNGSGKSTLLLGITHSVVLGKAFELGFAEKGSMVHIDKLYFLGGANGNMAEGQSSFMENVDLMIKIRKEVQALYKEGKKVIISGDEFMGGKTIHKESVAIQYPYWKNLQSFANLISIICTHDIELQAMAKKEKYDGFDYATISRNKDTGMSNFKVIQGKSIDGPASTAMLKYLGYPESLLKETIGLLKKDRNYPFRHLLQGEKNGISMNACVDILIVLFFVIGGVIIMYRRNRHSSKEDETKSSEK